jgi:hypothetical protein
MAPFSEHLVMVYQDVKLLKLLFHNVCTSQTDKHPAYSPNDIHQELIANNPVYLTITQKSSWVKNPANFISDQFSVSFAFEDPDGKITVAILHSHKALYLFGDRSPMKGLQNAKELCHAENGKGQQQEPM